MSSFLGHKINNKQPIDVIGGGISGLVLGFYLKQNSIPFKIYEKENYVGGLLGSHETPFGLVEQAANGIMWSPEWEEIITTLNIDVLESSKTQKKRYIVRNDKLMQFPLSIGETFQALKTSLLAKQKSDFSSVAEFGNHFFGKKFTDHFLSKVFSGIYATHINDLSLQNTFTMAQSAANRKGWILKNLRSEYKKSIRPSKSGRKGSVSFKNGMQGLINALFEYLAEDIEFREIRSLNELDTANRKVLTLPAYAAAKLVDDPILKEELSSIQYNQIITTTLFFYKRDLPKLKPGFGCLLPYNEDFNSLGVLFNHSIFEDRVSEQELASLTFIVNPNYSSIKITDNQELIVDYLMKDCNRLFGAKNKPVGHKIFKWKQGLPLYSKQHEITVNAIDKHLKLSNSNLNLLGNYTGEIALRGIVKSAKKSILI